MIGTTVLGALLLLGGAALLAPELSWARRSRRPAARLPVALGAAFGMLGAVALVSSLATAVGSGPA